MSQASPIVGPASLTPEWYEAHRKYITATDLAPILGRSDYKTAFDVFCEKTGRIEPFTGNEHTRRGQRYEPVIAQDYSEATGYQVLNPLPMFIHPICDWLAATPDGLADNAEGTDPHGLEVKFSMSPARASSLGEEGTDEISDDWLLQTQGQMSVMGWLRVDLAVLLYGRLRIYPVQRNDDLIQIIESASKEMHERIQADEPPEPDWSHPQTARLVKALYGVAEGVSVALSDDTAAYWARYQELGKQIKALDEERESQKARVLVAMGEAAMGELPDGSLLTRSRVERNEYTVKATSYVTLRQKKTK